MVKQFWQSGVTLLALAGLLAACGGNSANPLANPPAISNPGVLANQILSFAYFQKCINPVFLAQLQSQQSGLTNTCAGSGCHADATGAGGALRIVADAALLDLSDPANTAAVIRASAMYKNFYSAKGEVIIGAPTQSRLLNKPLLRGVLHGGGLIFSSASDPNALLFSYWISHPMPVGQDEFSTAGNSMFTPADPKVGTCNTQ